MSLAWDSQYVEQIRDDDGLPSAADERGLAALRPGMPAVHGEQKPRRDRNARTLDPDQLQIAAYGGVCDEPGRRLGDHHTARWRDRLHSLCHSNMGAHRCVTRWLRTDLAGHHLAGVETDPHRIRHPVALYLQGSKARAGRMVLQRDGRPEQRHDPVAGEFVDRAAEASYDGAASGEQVGHDLAQPLGIEGRRQVHRPDDVGE
jgi:hypothetical protein